MPNWCWNNVTISHPDKTKIAALVEELEKEKDCNLLHSIRPRLEESIDWCIRNWGTKWDVDVHDWEMDDFLDTRISIAFDSAWSPPIALYDYMTQQGFQIDALYFEEGEGFVGKYVDGIDDCYDTNDDLDVIPEDLIEYSGLYNKEEEDHGENSNTGC